MKSRGTERPTTMMTRMPVIMWRGSLKRLENMGLFRKSRMAILTGDTSFCEVLRRSKRLWVVNGIDGC